MPDTVASHKPHRKTLWFTSLYTLLASIVVVTANFIVNIIVTRTISSEGVGNYALMLSTGYVMMVVVGQSLTTGLAYVVSRNRPAIGSLVLQIIGVCLFEFFVAYGMLWMVQKTVFSEAFLPGDTDQIILILAALLPVVQNMGEYWRIILITRQEAVKANQVVMIQRLLQVMLIAALGGVYYWGGVKVSYVPIIGLVILSFLLANILYIKYLSPLFSYGASRLKEVFVFSIPVYLGDLFRALNYRMDVFFVSYFQNPSEVGFYVIAVQTANLILLVANAFATNLLPRIAASRTINQDDAHRSAQVVRIIFWFNLVCVLGLASLSWWLIPILYTEKFVNSVTPLLLILPGTWLLSLTFIITSYINGIGKTRINLFISLITFFAILVLDILLIPRYSIIGASIASSIAYTVGAIFSMGYFLWKTGLPIKSLVWINHEDIFQLRTIIGQFRKQRQ